MNPTTLTRWSISPRLCGLQHTRAPSSSVCLCACGEAHAIVLCPPLPALKRAPRHTNPRPGSSVLYLALNATQRTWCMPPLYLAELEVCREHQHRARVRTGAGLIARQDAVAVPAWGGALARAPLLEVDPEEHPRREQRPRRVVVLAGQARRAPLRLHVRPQPISLCHRRQGCTGGVELCLCLCLGAEEDGLAALRVDRPRRRLHRGPRGTRPRPRPRPRPRLGESRGRTGFVCCAAPTEGPPGQWCGEAHKLDGAKHPNTGPFPR